jgi:putative ABC transport system permease protein
LAVFLVIGLYVYHEHTYDTYHPEADRIARLAIDYGGFGVMPRVPAQTGARLAEAYPEVETVARLYPEDVALRVDDRRMLEEQFMYADPSIFDLFALPLLRGSDATALDDPDTVVLTEATARRLFGTADVVGEMLQRAEGPSLRVTGVLEALPSNTHLDFDALISYATLRRGDLTDFHAKAFGQQGYAYFLLTAPGAAAALQTKLDTLVAKGADAVREVTGFSVTNTQFEVQALSGLHVTTAPGGGEMKPPVDPRVLWMFGGLGVFILGIAVMNYVNLATAQATRRATEVGVRKTMGAHRGELVWLFLGEALVLSLAAVAGAAVLIEVLRPLYGTLLGTSLSALSFRTPAVWGFYLAAAVGVALLAGSYPAWVLTRYQPAEVMRGTGSLAVGGRRFRQGLVVFQFAASIVLIALTFVIRGQVEYAMQQPLGYTTQNLVTLPLAGELGDQMDSFRQEAERITGVESAARGGGNPASHATMMSTEPGGDPLRVNMIYGDARYPKAVGFDLLAGRTYTSRPADSTAVLINETAARMYDLHNRLDQPLSEPAGPVREGQRVVGIVRDFHMGSFREPIRPAVIERRPERYDTLVLRLHPDRPQDALAALEALWYTFAPNQPFLHQFADEMVQSQYRQEQTLSRRLGAFALLAVLVAGLGLFGLAAFTAEQRTKEMSIRKVLGASMAQIVMRLNREFVVLVGLAFVVALPLAVWMAQRWLQDFAYRMDLSPGLFVWAGGLALLAALLPVSYHALRAAAADPATTLRNE